MSGEREGAIGRWTEMIQLRQTDIEYASETDEQESTRAGVGTWEGMLKHTQNTQKNNHRVPQNATLQQHTHDEQA